jgi:hypothetical protein
MGVAVSQHRPEDLSGGTEEWELDFVYDGTLTRVQVIDNEGEVVSEGVARRRKGDTRNEELGLALATSRALRDAADFYLDAAREYGYVEERSETSVNLTPAIKQATKASNAFDKFVRELRYALGRRSGEKVG